MCVLLLKFNDVRIERNVKSLINSIIKRKTTKLKTLSKDNKEYEKYHTLLNGELKNVLDEATSIWDKDKKQSRQIRKYIGRDPADKKSEINLDSVEISTKSFGNIFLCRK